MIAIIFKQQQKYKRSECNGGDTKSLSSSKENCKYNLIDDDISSDANKIEVLCNDQVCLNFIYLQQQISFVVL